jgi:hypothetical protein
MIKDLVDAVLANYCMLQDQYSHASLDKLCYCHCLLQSVGLSHSLLFVLLDLDSTAKYIRNG